MENDLQGVEFRSDFMDCHIDICSSEVPQRLSSLVASHSV